MRVQWLFIIVVAFVLATSMWQGVLFYFGNEGITPDLAAEGYFSFLSGRQVSGEIWTANPVVSAYTDHEFEKVYYPVYHQQQYSAFYEYLMMNSSKISAVLLDNCGGGIVCAPGDKTCEKQTDETFRMLSQEFVLAYDRSTGRCWYRVFTH